MSIVETLHAEHKARMLRFARAAVQPSQPAVSARPAAVQAPLVIPPRQFDAFEEYAWRVEIEGVDSREYRAPSIYDIRDAVCAHFGVKLANLISSNRTKSLTRPRHTSYYLATKLTLQSFPEIGRRHGGRDHTTVLHGANKIARLLLTDVELRASIEFLKRTLGAHDISENRKTMVKMTEDSVRAIRASTLPQPVLAEKYGVLPCTISSIKARLTWKNVE